MIEIIESNYINRVNELKIIRKEIRIEEFDMGLIYGSIRKKRKEKYQRLIKEREKILNEFNYFQLMMIKSVTDREYEKWEELKNFRKWDLKRIDIEIAEISSKI